MTPSPRAFDAIDPRLADIYRGATPSQKLAVVSRLNATLIGLKEADLFARHPAATGEQRRRMLRHWWLTASD
jgi:hypothetical protein